MLVFSSINSVNDVGQSGLILCKFMIEWLYALSVSLMPGTERET